jgi:hypothetical protein
MIQRQTQNILPTRINCQLKYTANDNKLTTTISVSEENFSLAEKIESVPVHFKDQMYQYILSQNQHPPTCNGNSNNTGDGVGNNVAGDKVGNGEGDKINRHQCHCCRCCCHHRHHPCLRCRGSCLKRCCRHHNCPMPSPSAQPLQRLSPSPTSLTPQSNGDDVGNGDKSDG